MNESICKNSIIVNGVHGYLAEDGTAMLNAEDVAKGWGFTQKQVKNGKKYESVRWITVNNYLKEFGFPQQVGESDYIPENVVYRLGFKANNEVAQKFQAILADKVLPSLRKTGQYKINQNVQQRNIMLAMANELEATEKMARIMQRFFKMDESMSKIFALRTGLNGTYQVIDKKTVDTFIKQLPASSANDTAEYNASSIAKELAKKLNKKISAQTVNGILKDMGYQEKISGRWELTDKANDYANKVPFQNDINGHCGFQIKWKKSIVDVLMDYYNAA
jgi:prophage antirepressor-like protein